MKVISPQRRAAIQALLMDGASISVAARDIGVNKRAVLRYRAELKFQGRLPEVCACGREAGHDGWCPPRLERSPRRPGPYDKRQKNGGKVLVEIRHIPPDHRQKAAVLDALPRIDVPATPFEPNREAELAASHANRRRRTLARRFKDRPPDDLATILARSGPVVIKRLPPGHHLGRIPSWLE